MYIDPRVAAGIAKRAIEDAPTFKRVCDQIYRLVVQYEARIPSDTRQRRRYIEQKLFPLIKQLYPNAVAPLRDTITENRYSLFIPTFLREEAGSVDFGHCVFNPQILRITFARNGTFSEHAISRLLQRNRTTSFDEIEPTILKAIPIALMISHKAKEENWKQIGVVVEDSIFVGDMIDESPVLKTWFKLDRDRPSRWNRYAECIKTALRTDVTEIYDHMMALDLRSKFPFLMEEYAFTGDPEDWKWSASV